MERIIRIQAKCDRFEIDEQIEESKSVKRLQQIKKIFLHRKVQKVHRREKYIGRDKLQVTTSVVNPFMF